MFSIYPNPNFSANTNPNVPKPAICPSLSDCYIQACRILAGGCGISTVSRVRVRVKVTVRDRCVKGLVWYVCSIPVAE